MSTVNIGYSGGLQAITFTSLTSLANAAACQSTKIDNTSNKYVDISLDLAFKLTTGTPGSDGVINVYLAGSIDGTRFDYPATGSDASIAAPNSTTNNLKLAYVCKADVQSTTFSAPIASVAAFFGGVLPPYVAVIVENRTNIAFTGTAGDHTKQYEGIVYTVA